MANAYIEKALSWSNIKNDDGSALHAYALYLRGCCNTMGHLQEMHELNLPSNLKLILSKLPYKLKEKWRTTAYELLEKNRKRAVFSDLVSFIETQAKILQDPLFGEIQETPRRIYSKPTVVTVDSKTQQRLQKNKSSSFVMSVNNCKTTCCICGRANHSLDQCEKLKAQSHDVKVQLLRNNGICFGCLNKGHL